MFYILYNPLSKNGNDPKVIKKVDKLMKKKNEEYELVNIVELAKDPNELISRAHRTDSLVVLGGDGTLHRFANAIQAVKTNGMKMFLYRGGTGNDFGREFKGHLIDITDIVFNIPFYQEEGKEKELFLNCTGFGLDGEVCNMVNKSFKARKGINYLKSVLKLFKEFPRYDLEVTVDGVLHRYKNVWLATVMNGKYFGGGMKIAPDSNRFDDDMELYVIHSVSRWKLILIFPLIFIGKHMWFKRVGIDKIQGRCFSLKALTPQTLQTDGEVREEVSSFIVSKEIKEGEKE